ncbi:MAG: rhomboid family intramembrane serine protease [Polyangiaceae bacterium]
MSPHPPPRPVYVAPAGEGRLVPKGWLDDAPVTRMLLALNVAVFLVETAITHMAMDLPTRPALQLGAIYSPATVGELRLETLVTACFLHAGVLHIGFNMLALWQGGPLVERAVGSARMAPMYLLAGVFGNVLSVGVGWLTRSAELSLGASGAISGVLAAALVIGWRAQGWRGPLTQAMLRWLGFIVVFGLLSSLTGGHIDNAAHLGGALAGALIATRWRRGFRYSDGGTRGIVAACAAVVVASIAVVGVRDKTDRFAAMTLQDRAAFTNDALAYARCRDAREGVLAVERLLPRADHRAIFLQRRVTSECGGRAVY